MSDLPIRDVHPSAYARVNAMLRRQPGQMVNDDFRPTPEPEATPDNSTASPPESTWPARSHP